jgi:hypothetical protein
MILLFDNAASEAERGWERVDWETLEPGMEDDVYDENAAPDRAEAPDGSNGGLIDMTLHVPRPTVINADDYNIVFTKSMKKRFLKDHLQTSFRVQWLKGKLQWPRNFTKIQKLAVGGSLTRAAYEVRQAIHALPSQLRALDPTTGQYSRPVGNGLFHSLSLRRDELVAYFVGTWKSAAEFDDQCSSQPDRAKYALAYC